MCDNVEFTIDDPLGRDMFMLNREECLLTYCNAESLTKSKIELVIMKGKKSVLGDSWAFLSNLFIQSTSQLSFMIEKSML